MPRKGRKPKPDRLAKRRRWISSHDRGTDELQAKKQAAFGNEGSALSVDVPLDVLRGWRLNPRPIGIAEAQHEAGWRLAELAWSVHGVPCAAAARLERQDRGHVEITQAAIEHDARAAARYARALDAMDAVSPRARRIAVNVCVHLRPLRVTFATHRRAADERDLDALQAGLWALAEHFGLGRARGESA